MMLQKLEGIGWEFPGSFPGLDLDLASFQPVVMQKEDWVANSRVWSHIPAPSTAVHVSLGES